MTIHVPWIWCSSLPCRVHRFLQMGPKSPWVYQVMVIHDWMIWGYPHAFGKPHIAMIWKNIVKPIDMIWYNYKLNRNNRSVWHRWYHYTDSWCWCTLFIYYSASIISMTNIDKQCTEVGASATGITSNSNNCIWSMLRQPRRAYRSKCPNSGTTHFIQFFAYAGLSPDYEYT